MISNTIITIRSSSVAGNVPPSLLDGELAINSFDGKLFYKTPSNTITSIQNQTSFSTINANSSLIVATSPTSILTINAGNNVSISSNATSKSITIGTNSVSVYSNTTAGGELVSLNSKGLIDPTLTSPISNTYTSSYYNLTLSDAGNFVIANTSANSVVYINANIIPVNLSITIIPIGTGFVSIVGNSGTTVVNTSSQINRTRYSPITVLQPEKNFFIVTGDVA